MDISSLTNLITAFRAETRQNSITPDTLGLLLQKIVNVLENATEYTVVQQLEDWEGSLTGLGSVLTKIGLGSDDRNNIYLNIGRVNTTTGIGLVSTFSIRQVTTERAGAMRAQQVTDLNGCKSDIKSLQSSISTLLALISELQSTDTSLSNRITSVENEQPYPFRLRILEGKLYIHDLDENIKNSCQPFIFRWVKKHPHYRVEEKSFYGMRRKGWNVWRGCDVAQLDANGMLQIEHNHLFNVSSMKDEI